MLKTDTRTKTLDLEQLRQIGRGKTGREYWRSLDELAETPEFEQLLAKEFPMGQSVMSTMPRRQFLVLMGASLGLAGLTGCGSQPKETIVPYVKQPDLIVPGRPLYFATGIPFAGFATGVVATSHMGRPTKLEGNDKHPD